MIANFFFARRRERKKKSPLTLFFFFFAIEVFHGYCIASTHRKEVRAAKVRFGIVGESGKSNTKYFKKVINSTFRVLVSRKIEELGYAATSFGTRSPNQIFFERFLTVVIPAEKESSSDPRPSISRFFFSIRNLAFGKNCSIFLYWTIEKKRKIILSRSTR
jgi:hypothetical protein